MINKKLIKRWMYKPLLAHLNNLEISMIVGPRQAGKTTLMKMIQDHLVATGKKCLFLNLDFETDNQYFISQNALIKKIKLEFGESQGYVFIDEIQRKENAGLFLKGIYDQGLPCKFIISGSGSVELKEKIHESLAGRKRMFELYPVSFTEFIDFKTGYLYADTLEDFFSSDKTKTNDLLEEYLGYGGYPKVILAATKQEKLNEINEIYNSYIEKDITSLMKIRRPDAFSELIKVLGGQIGQLVNYSELSNTLNVSLLTIKNYLWYAEKTFVVERITPYARNIRKEITKSPMYYFYDLGLRNFSTGQLGDSSAEKNGFIFQNLILHILKERLHGQNGSVHYWRTKDKAEVDFVIARGKEILPVEVKYRDYDFPQIARSLRSFISRYSPKYAYVVNKNYRQEIEVDKTKVIFLPYSDLLFKEI